MERCKECGSGDMHVLGGFADGEKVMMIIHEKNCRYMNKADKKCSFMLYRDKQGNVKQWPSRKKLAIGD